MALSDYMPYGAPELLEGASPRMAQATFTASGLVAAIVCSLGLLIASRPVIPQAPPGGHPHDEFTLDQFDILQPRMGATHGSPRAGAVASEFHPVDIQPPAIAPIEDPGPIGHESSTGDGPEVVRGDVGGPPPPIPDPPLGTYVYTDELPQLVRAVKPVYPDLAREAGVEGTVRLQLLVGLDGHVARAIVRPGGSVPMLDEAAIAAALATVFTPALANNRPVKVWVTQDYRFTLH